MKRAAVSVGSSSAVISSLNSKNSVRAATVANVTIATALNNGDSLDGITLATGDRVLVKDQTAPAENGIYIVAASPSRATDFDAWSELRGATIVVIEGTVNAATHWLCNAAATGTLGTTAVTFTSIS